MLMEINKNIIFSNDRLIIHGCNCQGVMGSGVAKAIRERFPVAYTKYQELHAMSGIKLGLVQFVHIPNENRFIGNCFTQDKYGFDGKQYANYYAIEDCLAKVKQFCFLNNITQFSMPKIGCGLGGLKWELVEKLILRIFNESSITTPVVYDKK